MPIDVDGLQAQEQITAIYVAYYDRAPDPVGLQFWVDQLEGGRSIEQIATDFSSAAETIDKYPFFESPGLASGDNFITSIYVNLFGRTPDDAGREFWTNQLESGSTPVGEIILAILEGAQSEATGGFPDEETVTNKIDVGLDWTVAAANEGIGTASNPIAEDVDGQVVVNNQAAFESATSILDGVDGTEESVTAAKTLTDAFFATGGGTGESFVLTTGLDNLEGTIGSDVFIASLTGDAATTTYNTGDEIDGASGLDTFRITASDDNFEDEVVFLNNIEVVEVRNFSGTTLDLNPTQWSGINEFVFTGEDDIDIGNGFSEFLGEDFSTVTFRNFATDGSEDAEIEVAASVFTGSDDALTVNLFNAGNASNGNRAELELQADTSGALTQDAVIEHLTVNSAEGDNFFEFDDSGVLKTLTITGDADLLMDLGSEDALTSVDASAHTGDLEFENLFDLQNDFTYTGSQGADVIDVDSGNSSATPSEAGNTVTINTGTGDDNVEIDEQEDNIVNVDLGEGDDRLELNDAGTVLETIQTNHSYEGGAGDADVLAMSSAAANAIGGDSDRLAVISGFEQLAITNSLADDQDLTAYGFNRIVLEDVGGSAGTITMASGDTIELNDFIGTNVSTGTIVAGVENASTSTSDVVNLESNIDFDGAGSTDQFTANVDVASIETVNITATDPDEDTSSTTDSFDFALINGDEIETITVDASVTTTVSENGTNFTAITTFDASASTAGVTVDLSNAAQGVTATGGTGDDNFTGSAFADTIDAGAGDDVIIGGDGADSIDAGAGDDNITGGSGADELTGGAGADTFVYGAVGESSGLNIDTITDFVSGEDIIDLSAIMTSLGATGSYLGEVSGTNAVNSAFTGTAGEVILDTSTNELIVDEGDGTVGAGDLVIKLTGVTDLDGTTDFIF